MFICILLGILIGLDFVWLVRVAKKNVQLKQELRGMDAGRKLLSDVLRKKGIECANLKIEIKQLKKSKEV